MAGLSTTRLTKRVVEGLNRGQQVWDAEIKGFGARRQRGLPVYFVSYRKNGRRRWITLGTHGAVTPEQARKAAQIVLGDVARGLDPAQQRDLAKSSGTIRELAERFIEDYAIPHNKPSSVEGYKLLIRTHICPQLGTFRVEDLGQADIARWHSQFKSNRIAGNRTLALLKHMLNLAERWGLRAGPNPARFIEMYPEKSRERLLSAAELAQLGSTLDQIDREGSEHSSVTRCIRLLVLTGARLSEILKLKWDYVDLSASVLRLPDSKTGPKNIPLGAPALELLGALNRANGPFVCPGEKPESCFVGIQRPWRRIRALAQIEDVRIHDLRHAFASIAVMGGDSLFLVGKVLGHKQASTTERYAHLQDDPVRAVADRTSKKIAAAMSGHVGTVVPLRNR